MRVFPSFESSIYSTLFPSFFKEVIFFKPFALQIFIQFKGLPWPLYISFVFLEAIKEYTGAFTSLLYNNDF